MSDLIDALKQRFKTPQEALRALGLDERLLSDSKENIRMANNKLLTRKAAMVQGALTAFLAPLVALRDEMPDLTPGLRGITDKNYAQKKPALAKYVAEKCQDSWMGGVSFAEDATPEGLHVLLEALSKVAPAEEAMKMGEREQGMEPKAEEDAVPDDMGGMENEEPVEQEPEEEEPEMGSTEDPDDGSEAAESEGAPEEGGVEGIKMFLKGELSPEAFARLEEMLQALGGDDGDQEEEGEPEMAGEADEAPDDDMLDESEPSEEEDEEGMDEPPMFSGRPKVPGKDKKHMDKGAMDEDTVKGLVTAAVLAERVAQKALQEALKDVRPYVGDVMGCDSAEQAYTKALSIKGIKPEVLKGASIGIMQAMLRMQPTRPQSRTATFAQDEKVSATGKSFNDYFPEAARIGNA